MSSFDAVAGRNVDEVRLVRIEGAGYFTASIDDLTVSAAPPAAPSAPDLADASDLGRSNSDDFTSADSLTFTGTGAEAGATVTVWADLDHSGDRKSVVEGKSGSVRVDLGGRRIITKKKTTYVQTNTMNQDN